MISLLEENIALIRCLLSYIEEFASYSTKVIDFVTELNLFISIVSSGFNSSSIASDTNASLASINVSNF